MSRKNIFPGTGVLVLLAVAATSAWTATGENGATAADRPCHTPKTYPDSIASFNKQPVITGRILFLGNSITQRANWRELLDDPTVINRGIGGDVTCGILNRLDDVIKRKPAQLFLLIGINDMQIDLNRSGKIDMDGILENYQAILQRLRTETPDSKIYVQSVLPTNSEMRRRHGKGKPLAFSAALNDGVRTLNPRLKRLAADYRCIWINSYAVFEDANGELSAGYTDDGIHPNERGYKHLVAYMQSSGFIK